MGEHQPIFETTDGNPVKFPFNRQPCLKPGESYLIHFVSSSDTWYAYIFNGSGVGGSYDPYCKLISNSFTSNQLKILNYYSGLTGACCTQNGTCEITQEGNCFGFFNGVGTTCGNLNTQNCSIQLGSCCVKNTIDGKKSVYCIENISPYDCLTLNSSGVETIFNGINKTCEEIDCNSSFEQVGACCDGKGGCEQLTKEICISTGKSFLGRGILCNSFDNQLCSSGTGACCYSSGICSEVSSQTCFDNFGFYHGNNTICSGITCNSNLDCGQFLNYKLKPGDLYGGGVVVGVFNPKSSMLLGASHAFSRQGTTLSFLYGGLTTANYYQSEYDYVGYGITGEDCTVLRNQNIDSYYMIVSLYPASIDENGNAVNPTETITYKETFSWYGNGIAWGPIHNVNTSSFEEFTFLDKSYEELYLQYGEGYYGITAESLNNIKTSTFQLCSSTRINGSDPVARLFTKNIKTSNGLWNRNWGLYNTIRMLSADNAYYLQTSSEHFTYDEFESNESWNSVYALKLFDNDSYTNSYGITANPDELSDWYIPSHDELAFLAANCITDTSNRYHGFDLNSNLLQNNGVPIYGWHWSSTGSFDETSSSEGIYVSGKPTHGTVAWSIYFDENGNSSDFYTVKNKRSEELKIRPIRMIRCDGKIPDPTSDSYKLWKTPNLLRNSL